MLHDEMLQSAGCLELMEGEVGWLLVDGVDKKLNVQKKVSSSSQPVPATYQTGLDDLVQS